MEKQKFDELLEKLQDLDIVQESSWDECIPDDIWEEYFDKHKVMDSIDTDEHRWYEVETIVVKVEDRYLGIRAITKMYSESSSYEDMYHTLEFFEMVPIQVTSYKKK